MKAQHRHELRTNELAEWLTSLPQWARKNKTTIIYIAALIVVVAAVYFWKRYQKHVVSAQKQLELTRLINQIPQTKMQVLRAQPQGRDLSLMLLQPADNLQVFAQNTKNDLMAALAFIKRAEALRTEIHYRPETPGKQEVIDQINLAKTSYTKAIDKASSSPLLMATAKFGLGLCEEELGNFEKAKQIYHDIIKTSEFEGTVAVAQAKQRLDTMADYQQKVAFKPSPKTPPARLVQPQLQLSPADFNIAPQAPNNVLGNSPPFPLMPSDIPNAPTSQQ